MFLGAEGDIGNGVSVCAVPRFLVEHGVVRIEEGLLIVAVGGVGVCAGVVVVRVEDM